MLRTRGDLAHRATLVLGLLLRRDTTSSLLCSTMYSSLYTCDIYMYDCECRPRLSGTSKKFDEHPTLSLLLHWSTDAPNSCSYIPRPVPNTCGFSVKSCGAIFIDSSWAFITVSQLWNPSHSVYLLASIPKPSHCPVFDVLPTPSAGVLNLLEAKNVLLLVQNE